MNALIAAAGPSAYWYLSRATGAVALVLLTVSVVIGILGSVRFAGGPRWPRFAIDSLHRDVSLLVLVLLAAHIVTSVLDSFAPIKLIDAVVPLSSAYRPLWLGLGALAFDLLLAVAITSIIRRRLGYGAWRAVHWLAYASWPVAVLHGIGSGTDTKESWMLGLTAACAGAVLIAVLVRVGRSADRRWKAPALALATLTPVGIVLFTLAGPLQPGWASRSGTPRNLLGSSSTRVAAASTGGATAARNAAPALKIPFSARLTGSAKQKAQAGGAIVDLSLRLSGGARGRLRVRMGGAPIGGGGLSMTGSQVDLVADGLASVMQGRIVSLAGQQFEARVRDASGSRLDLHADLSIDSQTGAVNGTLNATSSGGG
ncbi:MAG: ferric reductase-like transmembrane domain-containing protein [Solirubrobacteraceae bacterium]